MKRRKVLLSEEELLVRDKVCRASKRASETREQTLHRQKQNRTHMISVNTCHLACAEVASSPVHAKNGGAPGTHCLRMCLISPRSGYSELLSDSSALRDVRVRI